MLLYTKESFKHAKPLKNIIIMHSYASGTSDFQRNIYFLRTA